MHLVRFYGRVYTPALTRSSAMEWLVCGGMAVQFRTPIKPNPRRLRFQVLPPARSIVPRGSATHHSALLLVAIGEPRRKGGMNFFASADVYGMARSARRIGEFLRRVPGDRFIATKLGRFLDPGLPETFSVDTLRANTEASLRRLGVEAVGPSNSTALRPRCCVRAKSSMGSARSGGKARSRDQG
jgi:hypothetical protein